MYSVNASITRKTLYHSCSGAYFTNKSGCILQAPNLRICVLIIDL